jgi:hypothetical protein
LLTLPGGVAATSEAAGTASFRPDARVRLQKTVSEWFGTSSYDDPWTGDDVYNATASGQTIRARYYTEAYGWDRSIFGVSLQNDGSSSDALRVRATGTTVDGWTVKYFVGNTNVTSAVVNGTFTTASIAPGNDQLIKVKVTRHELFHTDALRQLISVESVSNPSKLDVVKLVFKPGVTCGC